MVEGNPQPIERKRREDAYLERIARASKRVYFSESQKPVTNREQKSFSEDQITHLSTSLNRTLRDDGHIIIIDFPFPFGEDAYRIQVVSAHSYFMLLQGAGRISKDFILDKDFYVQVTQPEYQNVEGALTVSIFSEFQHNMEHIHSTTWNESLTTSQRFAILTRDNTRRWRAVLDFRRPVETGEPVWKVNPRFVA